MTNRHLHGLVEFSFRMLAGNSEGFRDHCLELEKIGYIVDE